MFLLIHETDYSNHTEKVLGILVYPTTLVVV